MVYYESRSWPYRRIPTNMDFPNWVKVKKIGCESLFHLPYRESVEWFFVEYESRYSSFWRFTLRVRLSASYLFGSGSFASACLQPSGVLFSFALIRSDVMSPEDTRVALMLIILSRRYANCSSHWLRVSLAALEGDQLTYEDMNDPLPCCILYSPANVQHEIIWILGHTNDDWHTTVKYIIRQTRNVDWFPLKGIICLSVSRIG